ncbi:MAG: hypothetical protein HDR88_09120 [Bacteroides sp.]|nr:hypothetical protein [Bacteroides sp.]
MSRVKISRQNIIAAAVGMAAACFVVNVNIQTYAQIVKKKALKEQPDTYTRPKPMRPIHPIIPGVNRYQEDKIFLEYADSLYKTASSDTIEKQILKGGVKFRQAGMWMYCDSAYYYPQLNSLDAFGNVKMEQGDTLFVYADKLFYEGNEKIAKLKNGPSRNKVKLINRDVTLTTDSLDYDLSIELGWYSHWGTIDDKVNTLTSLYGEYSPDTKNADFYHDVRLVNNEDGFILLTDTLYYNTLTHIARIESHTEIQGANDTIITTRGIYNTELGDAELLTRSIIIHRDSNNNVVTLEGDSIIYDKQMRISRAYMFRDPFKHGMPMVLTDTAHKTTLIGGFGLYNDSTREALACQYPLLMEYSQADTLFLRADTIKTFIVTALVSGNRRWTLSGFPEKNGVPIIKSDSSRLWVDTVFFSLVAPFTGTPLRLLNAAVPKHSSVKTEIKEPKIPLSDFDSIPIKNPDETISEKDVPDSIPKYPKDFHVALAYYRARFFKQDIQGVADSIVVVEQDSMLYMFRKPIVWSGERQVTGNRIDVHFNDSTADWALLPESGLMSEHIDEDFYNQLSGKNMLAIFSNQTLKRLDVSGNVETIFLPQESDSTFNRLINAESSFLTIELDNEKMDKLKMWPEVSGSVTPIFLVKRAQMYLPKFRWWASLRPEREWYGDQIRWADNLGEVPDELEQYFLAPSDFGEPKSFSGTRFVAPISSFPSSVNFDGVGNIEGNTVFVMDSVMFPDKVQNADSVYDSLPTEELTAKENNISLKEINDNEKEMQKENEKESTLAGEIEEAIKREELENIEETTDEKGKYK